MPRFAKFLRQTIVALIAVLACGPLLAGGDHGGASGPEPLVFTVNLGNSTYLHFGLILETATPEAGHELGLFRPKIQHEIILLLSGKDPGHLRTLPGKKELVEEIIEAANHVIHSNEKNGVKEALFTKFIIQ